MVGRSTTTPGRFMFFFSPSLALFSHLHTMLPADGLHEITVRVMDPSAARMVFPGLTSSASFGYEHAIRFLFPACPRHTP
jgi:hypothetical protein